MNALTLPAGRDDTRPGQRVTHRPRPHGYAKYKLERCRCDICSRAVSEYNANRGRKKAYGTWQPYIDAEPARVHVRALMAAGVGWKRVADLAGVSQSTICHLLYGRPGRAPTKRLRPTIAGKILAVRGEPDSVADHRPVDSTGTRRRLQALVATGWPKAQLASRLNMIDGNFGRIFGRDQVTAATRRAVAQLYDQLWDQSPTTSAPCRSRAINYARARNWAPPLAWDDETIDDPKARPTTAATRTAASDIDPEVVDRLCGGRPVARATIAERREAVQRLHSQRLNDQQIADRTRLSARTVLRIRQELGLTASVGAA